MVKNDTHKVYRDGYNLPDIFEIDRLALLENGLVLVFQIDETYSKSGVAVAVGHLTEENELVVANGKLRGVNGLHNIYYAGHSRDTVENDPVTNNN